ncbi:MAG: sigma-54-dependent Fis family transcriptional regulator [Rickettsiales bacterium]|nr:sigma-54-dependent Fis family transcriptional regulator [Rickettsiales bacterium]
MTKRNLLIVDDEPTQCKILKKFIGNMGHNFLIMNSGVEVIDFFINKTVIDGITANDIDVMLLDLSMPDVDGLTVLRKIERIKGNIQIIVLTASEDIALAVNAINLGATDYIIKGKDDIFARLTASINNAIDKKNLKYQVSNLVRKDQNQVAFYDIIGQSDILVQAIDLAKRAVNLSIPLLIKGYEGSGKELIARAIHGSGIRSGKSFIVIECDMLDSATAIEDLFGIEKSASSDKSKIGKFREAEGGTIFFKKIDALNSEIQTRLVHFLQDGEFYSIGGSRAIVANVRLIASTSKDLAKLVTEKKFREDLRYAISIFPIIIPSLKDRGEKDVMMLAQHFCRTFSINENKKIKLINEAVTNLLSNCDWKDNVRQLKNYIFRAVVLCDNDSLEVEHFPQLLNIQFEGNKKSDLTKKRISSATDNSVEIFNELGICKSLSDIEEEIARKLMEKFSGNISEVAKQLNIARSTLYRKLKIEEEIDG